MKAVIQVAHIIHLLRETLVELVKSQRPFYIQINGTGGRISSVFRIVRKTDDGHDFAVLWDRNNTATDGD